MQKENLKILTHTMYFIHPVPELTLSIEWELSNKLRITVSVASSGRKEGKSYTHAFYILLKVLGLFTAYIEQQVTYRNEGPTYPVRHLRAPMFRTPTSKQDQMTTETFYPYERIMYLQHKVLLTDASSICASTLVETEFLHGNTAPFTASELLGNLELWN